MVFEGWQSRTLDDCATFVSGGTPSKSRTDFWTGTIPWVSAKDLKVFRLHDAEDHVTVDAVRAGSRLAPAGSIFLLVRGMTLHNDVPICVAMREMAFNQDIKALMPKSGVDASFLTYWLLSQKSALLSSVDSAGHGTGRLNTDTLKAMTVALPPLAEQKAIAGVLGALDDKIELNRRMNATLESMARALFQSWFVDFDPVRAKLDGLKPVALDPATAALFPDSFQDSPLGLIPQGWEVKTIADVTLRVTKGDTPRSEAIQACPSDDRLIPMLRVNTITEFGEVLLDKAEMIPESIHLGKSKRSILEENDILYTNAGTIGRVTLVQKHFLPANTNQAMAIIRPDPSRVPPAFLYMIMRQSEFQTNLHHDIVHAVQANLALGKISAARAVFPPMATLTRLTDPIVALLNKIFDNRNQSRILATLRDTLLPKLLSGELKVAEREN